MTHEELYEIDDKLAEAINKVCRRAGGENDNPCPREVREMFKECGFAIVPLVPTSE